jgi:hypothetical protein
MTAHGYIRPYSAAPPGGPTKVWLIGDSETRGMVFNPATGQYECRGGWRPALFQELVTIGADPDFVGHVLNSDDGVTTAGTAHSGANNSHGTVWYSSYFDTYAPGIAVGGNPHIVGIAVGTNDNDDEATATDFSRLVDKAAAAFPRANILMATAPISSTPGQFDAQAAQVRLEVAARKALGMHVDLVDIHAEADLRNGGWSDGLHGSDLGYGLIADVWIRAFLRLLAPSRLAA